MNDAGKMTLSALLGDYPNTLPLKAGEVRSGLVDFSFAEVKPANKGFKPLVREHKFDVGELAIVTYLQAMTYSKPYVLMPVVVVARDQHHTLVYNPDRGELRPEQLAGKRVGVRAYTVTTGVWVRGILHEQFGLDLDKIDWVTFDDPHLAEYADPPEIQRATAGKDIVQMLLDGEIDAAVVGDKLPDPRLKRLIPDHDAAATAWSEQHGDPINHMLVVRRELSYTRPDIVAEVFRAFKDSRDIAIRGGHENAKRLRFGLEANRRSLETIIRFAFEQKIIPEKYAVEDLFDEVTAELC